MTNTLAFADNIRLLSAAMVEKANSGHPGGPMGGADFMAVLYSDFIQYDPSDMTWSGRDRFFLDAGHMSAMLYATQCILGNYTLDDLRNFRQWGSPTPGHPELDLERGIENTSGPLGLGHAFGAGSAIAERFMQARFGDNVAHKSYIYISDGGIQEEISQGVGRIAGHLGLGNIVMFYDANDIQLSTEVDEVMTEDTAKKYESWGWHVVTIDGNDHDQIRSAIRDSLDTSDKPSLIIGKTVMGKGVKTADGQSYEGKVELHGKPLGKSNASYEETIKGLGGNPEEPFVIFEALKSDIEEVLKRKKAIADKKKQAFAEWEKGNTELAAKYHQFLSGQLPAINWDEITPKPNDASRNASATCLAYFADHVENMIVASADLCNSDKTEAFLKKSKAFTRNDFSGAFLQAGVSELTMSALATGMALHGGIIPVCATFFAFSDYMKPAIRVAALMEQPVKFMWTHDAFRVGEDGPTHQPIEQEAQLRLMEKVFNHSHKRSLVALRPADGEETKMCWKIALETTDRPSGLIFSRQNIKDVQRQSDVADTQKGGYIVKDAEGTPDVVMIANGSEVSTLMDGQVLLIDHDVNCRIVSLPSEGIFRDQSEAYQKSVLGEDVPRFGLTAGLPSNLEGIVGGKGKVWGLNHFGYSAPYTVLDEKFGFTAENVKNQVLELLAKT